MFGFCRGEEIRDRSVWSGPVGFGQMFRWRFPAGKRGVIFVRVNQVLVRLWALSVVCLTGCLSSVRKVAPAADKSVQGRLLCAE